VRHNTSHYDLVRAFARQANAATERVRTNPASVFPNLEPGRLIAAGDHPGRRIGNVVGLLQIVGGIQVDIGCGHVHLQAIGRRDAGRGRAIILIVFQQDLLVRASDKVARRNGEFGAARTTGSHPRQTPGEAGSFSGPLPPLVSKKC
jgi:hypothetical protein